MLDYSPHTNKQTMLITMSLLTGTTSFCVPLVQISTHCERNREPKPSRNPIAARTRWDGHSRRWNFRSAPRGPTRQTQKSSRRFGRSRLHITRRANKMTMCVCEMHPKRVPIVMLGANNLVPLSAFFVCLVVALQCAAHSHVETPMLRVNAFVLHLQTLLVTAGTVFWAVREGTNKKRISMERKQRYI